MSSSSDDSPVRKSPEEREKSSTPVSDEDNNEKVNFQRKSKLLSDSEEEEEENDSDNKSKASTSPPPKKAEHSNLFGDDDISSDSDEEKPKRSKSPEDMKRSGSERDSGGESDSSLHGIVMQNPDEIEEPLKKERILNTEASIPKTRVQFGDAPYFVKMPNFLSVSTHPFDAEHFEEDEDDDQVKMDEEGRNRLKLRVENTIRWRRFMNENNEEMQESNAKFVKWSDGTMSLYLGNEIFEVNMMPLNASNLPHLYAKQSGGMAAQSLIHNRITFRPHSTDSQTHRKVTLNMADRSRKSGQVKVMDQVGQNPEIQRREMAKKEEESLRAHIRRTQIQRNSFRPRRQPGMGGYSDDEDGMVERRPKGKRKEAPIIGASSDESEDEDKKKKIERDSDSDEEYRKRKQKQKKTIVTSDEDSS